MTFTELELHNQKAADPSAAHVLQFFNYGHLPEHLQTVAAKYSELARFLFGFLPPGPEKTVALRKLLESKDCAVRAVLAK